MVAESEVWGVYRKGSGSVDGSEPLAAAMKLVAAAAAMKLVAAVSKQGSISTIEKQKEGPSMAPTAPFVEETDWDDEGFVSQLTQEFCATPQPHMTKELTPLEQLQMGDQDDSYFRGKQLETIIARDGTPAMFERIEKDFSLGSSSKKLKQIRKKKGENSRNK
ncbi:ATP synthase gamma chain [Striga asiatica]|uniref:ATP synthase gamma chain n=1 Tax=Striga asiatica TaxID=4170 RepID=A0A5A7P610_STRAF|nr:ATP synthase gamma chain [Striga asiatica]